MSRYKLVVIVQQPSLVWFFVTPWTASCQASLCLTISENLPKFMSIASVMPSKHLILWCLLLLLPSVFPSIRVFSSESALCCRWPNYCSFSMSFQWVLRVVFFRIDWLDLLGVQGTLKNLLWHHTQKHQFFCILYGPTDICIWLLENIALARWTFVCKVNLCFLICCLYRDCQTSKAIIMGSQLGNEINL